MESTHPVLVKAMRACGALFTKTMTATNFIITTLTSSQDMMLLEFVCLVMILAIIPTHILMSSFSVQAKLHPARSHLYNACDGTTSVNRTLAPPTRTKIITEDVP